MSDMLMAPQETTASTKEPRYSTPGTWFTRLSVPIALVVIIVIGALASPKFLTRGNLLNVLNANSTVGLVALGITFVAVSGAMTDLSVPALVALGALISLGLQPTLGVVGAPIAGLAVATVGGAINGILVGYFRINPIIATLGTGFVLLGVSQIMTGGGILYGQPSSLSHFVGGTMLGIPVFVWMFVVVALILWPLLSRTAFGRWVHATGGNYEAARASGVPVRLVKALSFTLTGFLSGLCGVLIALSNGQARPIVGAGYDFLALTAVVIGGTSLFGGNGSIVRTVGGVLVSALIGNLIILTGLPTQSRDLVTGIIVVAAVAVDAYFRRKATRA